MILHRTLIEQYHPVHVVYRKILIIGLGLIFVQKIVFLGLFSGELIFGGVYYCKEFCVSK